MTETDSNDEFFALLEDNDIDFAGTEPAADVPVLSYRWCKSDVVASCPLHELGQLGYDCMVNNGMQRNVRNVRNVRHLRGDTTTGRRTRMTVLRSGDRSMSLLMTAGLLNTRDKAKSINAKLAADAERRYREKT